MAFDVGTVAWNNASLELNDKFTEYVNTYIENGNLRKATYSEDDIKNHRENIEHIEKTQSLFESIFHLNDKTLMREQAGVDIGLYFIDAYSFDDLMQGKDPKDEVSYFNQVAKLANGQILDVDKNNNGYIDGDENYNEAIDYNLDGKNDVAELALRIKYADVYGIDLEQNGKFTYNDYLYAENCISTAKNVDENSSDEDKETRNKVESMLIELYLQLSN